MRAAVACAEEGSVRVPEGGGDGVEHGAGEGESVRGGRGGQGGVGAGLELPPACVVGRAAGA